MPSHSTQLPSHVAAFRLAGAFSAVAVALCFLSLVPPAPAAIVTSGDVQPDDPASWTSSTTAYVGKTADGTLEITEGSEVSSRTAYIGYRAGTTGKVTVEGTGSTWDCGSSMYVGYSGNGTLCIAAGGSVSKWTNVSLGYNSVSSGVVTVDGAGSTWKHSAVFVGGYGHGTLSITRGGAVTSIAINRIGMYSGSSGKVSVEGSGSTWMSQGDIIVGDAGIGSLSITAGGEFVSGGINTNLPGTVVIGYEPGSTGMVTVDGDGSVLTGYSVVEIGVLGRATLSITHGGKVSNRSSGCIGMFQSS